MNESANKLAIPIAVIIAGALVAGAILFTNSSNGGAQKENEQQAKKVAIREVSSKDHILGNPGAKVIIVEYSDMECPFCKRFHNTLHQVLDQFGKDGSVAWVYRHYPIDQLHSKARKEAEATECVQELGGSEKFWEYLNTIYEITPANNGLDLDLLSSTAVDLGIDKTKFDECLASGRYASKIEADVQDGIAAGVKGTPYSIVVSKKGTQVPISGAQSFSVVSQVVKTLLEEK